MWVFLFGDLTLFAVFFVLYLAYRAKERDLFLVAQQNLNPGAGFVNTLLLLTSSLFVVLAMRDIRRLRPRAATRMIAAAFLGGLGFVIVKFFEYRSELTHGFVPDINDFAACYYLLTGFHLFHLVLGMGVLVFLSTRARLPRLTARQLAVVEGGACFWHLVDLLWIILFPLLYLAK
ncbi:MAG TPA: cytochrome c oxidase subunit 3 [Amycolatopsis sp.]|nr:cytochrome c oxidase subunit 3 [Amycolatopsis sp.]